jgi:NDP-hexose-3-ketoreductase
MQQSKIRLAVLGMASIAQRSVLPEVINSDRYVLAGVASRDAEKAKQNALSYHTSVFHGYDSILDKKFADAVYIPLPNSLHFEWVMKALEQGLHVWVEKSLACNAQEVQMLNDKASEKGLALLENFQFRFHSQLSYFQDLVRSGELGSLRSIRSSFGFPPFSDAGNIRYQAELGGGALLDAGAYPLKISQLFMNDSLEVAASNLNYDAHKGVDIWGGAYLRESQGDLFSQIAFGFDHNYECSIELWGSKGKLYTNRIFTAPPNYSPVILLDKGGKQTSIQLEPDHAFRNILSYFYDLIHDHVIRLSEYHQNKKQAFLLEQIKLKAHG